MNVGDLNWNNSHGVSQPSTTFKPTLDREDFKALLVLFGRQIQVYKKRKILQTLFNHQIDDIPRSVSHPRPVFAIRLSLCCLIGGDQATSNATLQPTILSFNSSHRWSNNRLVNFEFVSIGIRGTKRLGRRTTNSLKQFTKFSRLLEYS